MQNFKKRSGGEGGGEREREREKKPGRKYGSKFKVSVLKNQGNQNNYKAKKRKLNFETHYPKRLQ